MKNFTKILHPYNMKYEYEKRQFPVFVKVKYEDGVLSILGVEGPLPSGNCKGSCGQIVMHFDYHDISSYPKAWDVKMLSKLLEIWRDWHLNDMHAECEHQEAKGITYQNDPKNICDVCGYKIGSAWTTRQVPDDVLEWLYNLPDTDKTPAWV